jgi:vitamin B12 transporter
MNRTIFVAGLATLAAQSAAGQEAFDLGTLVVSPSLSPVPEGEVASTLEVLTGDEIRGRDTGARDTLARLPGVSYSANGGLGARSTINIRGLDNKYIGVRLDGIDVSDPTSTQTSFNFGQLVGSGLSRIEVLKGSQSALYGSEAIGGVVNLQSWRPTRDGASGEALLEAGSFGTLTGSASAGFRSERGEVALTLGRVETDGISARAGDDEDDGFEQTQITLSGRIAATETLTFGANAFRRDSDIEIDRSETDNSGETSKEETGARVFAELVTGPVTHRLSFSEFVIERRDPGGFTTAFDGTRREVIYEGNTTLGATADLDFGVSRTQEEAETSSFPEEDETVVSAFAELRWRPSDRTTVSLALRRDDNSDFGVETTGRLGLVHRLDGGVTLRAVAGTGYRAPSLYERYSAYGDPALEPETSESYEIALEKSFGDIGHVEATVFYSEIEDRIDFDRDATACGSSFGCYNQIPGLTTSQGVELAGAYALTERISVNGSYTYTDAETGDTPLARVPRYDLVLGLDADLSDAWSATGEIRRVADIQPNDPSDPGKVGDYTLVNLGVGYDVSDTTELYLRVENALDEDYETAAGYNMPGRAVFAGLRASF